MKRLILTPAIKHARRKALLDHKECHKSFSSLQSIVAAKYDLQLHIGKADTPFLKLNIFHFDISTASILDSSLVNFKITLRREPRGTDMVYRSFKRACRVMCACHDLKLGALYGNSKAIGL